MALLSGVAESRTLLGLVLLGSFAGGCGDVDIPLFRGPAPATGGLSGTGGAPVIGWGGDGPGPLGGLGGNGDGWSAVVDDFEDQNLKAFEPAGWWYGVNDGTGAQTVNVVESSLAPPRSSVDSRFVLEIASGGFTDWGSAIGVDVGLFEFEDAPLELRFSVAASRPTQISFHALDASGTHFTTNFEATTAWSVVSIRVDRLFVVENSVVRSLDVTALDELQWFVFDGTTTTYWLDDVQLTSF